MKIYTIIVTYNPMKWIDQCLSCLRESSVSTTTVVIDNCSADGAREYIPTHYPEVVWMPQEKNLGFGQGNNVGIRYALENGADYVLLLNQDAYLQKDAIERLLKYADGTHLMTPTHMNGRGEKPDFMFNYASQKRGLVLSDVMDNDDSYIVGEVCAACWFMPVSLIREIGVFNPLFFQYGEDNNYYQRMVYHRRGDVILVPKARVWHDRELHGNIKVFNAGRLHKDVLLAVTNINIGILKRWQKLIIRLLHCYHHIFDEPYKIGIFTNEMIWYAKNYDVISRSKQTEKGKGAWL